MELGNVQLFHKSKCIHNFEQQQGFNYKLETFPGKINSLTVYHSLSWSSFLYKSFILNKISSLLIKESFSMLLISLFLCLTRVAVRSAGEIRFSKSIIKVKWLLAGGRPPAIIQHNSMELQIRATK